MTNTIPLPRPWNLIQLKKGGLIRLETDSPDDKGTHIASFTAKREAEADYVYEACNSFDRLMLEKSELIAALHAMISTVKCHVDINSIHFTGFEKHEFEQAQQLLMVRSA